MRFKSYSLLVAAALVFSSCGKEFLDVKKDNKEQIIENVNHYMQVMDNLSVINTFSSVSLALVGAGEYYLGDKELTTWKINMPYEVNGYLWEKEIFDTKESTDWNNSYHRILLCNLALDVEKLTPTAAEQANWNIASGGAHFVRAFSYYQLAQLFCKPYDAATASTDLGVPLKTDYDVKVVMPTRSSVAEVYALILKDLEIALDRLPETPVFVNRPSKTAAAMLLAKVYMHMGDWEKVLLYSDMALKIKNNLISLKPYLDKASPFAADYGKTFTEIIFYSQIHKPSSTYTGMMTDSNLLKMYEPDDFRLNIYFNNTPTNTSFKGSLAGLYNIFAGFTTAELYLIRAEAYARKGDAGLAMADVNKLRKNRFPDGKAPLSITDANEALKYIIDERRRELYLRGTRWEDLRRLNKEPQFATTLKRVYDGKEYELKPGDIRWTLPLPDNEIQLSKYPQNPR